MDKIKHIGYFSYMALPTVYSDSLSYLEDISRLYQKLNEFITNYNVLIDYYNSLANLLDEFQDKIEEIDQTIAELEAWKNTFEQEIQMQMDALKSQLESEFIELSDQQKAQLDSAIQEMNNTLNDAITAQLNIVNTKLAQFEIELNENNEEMQAWVKAQIDALIAKIPEFENVYVIDPVTNELSPLQDALDSIYNYAGWADMTAAEYDSLGLSASEYDNWYDLGNSYGAGVTATRYDTFGREIFFKVIRNRISNPVSGRQMRPNLIIRTNTDLMRIPGCLTAKEYDDTGLTASEYAALNVTAKQYDWESNRRIMK